MDVPLPAKTDQVYENARLQVHTILFKIRPLR